MSKKVNLSIKDSDYEMIEIEARNRNLKVIDIVRERY